MPLQPAGAGAFPFHNGSAKTKKTTRGTDRNTRSTSQPSGWPVTSASEPQVRIPARAPGGSEPHWYLRGVLGRKATPPSPGTGLCPSHKGRMVDDGGVESGARKLLGVDGVLPGNPHYRVRAQKTRRHPEPPRDGQH